MTWSWQWAPMTGFEMSWLPSRMFHMPYFCPFGALASAATAADLKRPCRSSTAS